MATRAPARRVLAATATLALLATLATAAVLPATAPAASAATRPTAAVSMGDSEISGEAAGSYEPASNHPGDYCHRSAVAEIHEAAVPGIDSAINLACSGATTANVRLGGEARFGEPPQAEQLRAVARDHDVKLVVLVVGANDIGFANIVVDCIKAFFPLVSDCQRKWSPLIAGRAAATLPGIEQDLADIRAVMRDAGYADDAYQLVLQGYVSPVPAHMRRLSWFGQVWAGCPADAAAMAWAHDWVVPTFAAMSRAAADAAGARFLDAAGAFDGHEVCAAGASAATEWVRGTYIDVAQGIHGIGLNLVQESLHPLDRGHAQLGRCLAEFYALEGREGHCAIGPDGNLHAGAGATTPAGT